MRRERERDRKRETKREKEQEQEEDAKGTKVRYRGAATTNEHEYWYCTVWIVIVHRRVDGTHGRKKRRERTAFPLGYDDWWRLSCAPEAAS